ncbi:MAG: CsgG/HfaB family protein [Phycisphaerales bacterium]|nr:CsgG/HfaB family protein [Phycisphaerales bacterium]
MFRTSLVKSGVFASLCLFAWLQPTALVHAQAAPGLEPIGINEVAVQESVKTQAKAEKKTNELAQLTEGLTPQFINAFMRTRKFDVIARDDFKKILKEQDFSDSGNVDASDPKAAKPFKIKGIKYMLVPRLTNFQYTTTTDPTVSNRGRQVVKHSIITSAIGILYDTTTGKVLESVNVEAKTERYFDLVDAEHINLLKTFPADAANDIAMAMAHRVVDVIFPAKVAARGQQLTINRGSDTNIAIGQIWDAYAVGDEVRDPDTGELLTREETLVGKVQITRVEAKFSMGSVLSETTPGGITVGTVLRLPPSPLAVPLPPVPSSTPRR